MILVDRFFWKMNRVDIDKDDEDGKTLENCNANEHTGEDFVFFQDPRRMQGIRDE